MTFLTGMLRGYVRFADVLALAGAVAAAIALAVITTIMGAEILARAVLGFSLEFSWEYSTYLMAAMFFLGAAYTLRSGAHIRMGAAVEHLSPRVALALDVIATLIAIAVMSLVTYAMADLAWQAHLRGSISFTPMGTYMAIPQAFPAIGTAMVVIQLLARLAAHILGLPTETPVADDEVRADR